MSVVVCENVVKEFGNCTAVNGVSLTMNRGECFGVLGPNGAGKSTLISMIYGATSRTGGTLKVFGLDPQTQSREIKKRLGVVTQEDCLDLAMSVEENMKMFAVFVGVPSAEIEIRVSALLKFMALDHKSKEPIRALSGGMKRRLVFVRALLSDPDLIILDEPTTGLDPAVRHLLWDKIRELKARGTTILLTTHYMDEAERLCDRLVIMDQGKVQEEGAPKKLVSKHCPGYIAHFRAPANNDPLKKIASQRPEIHYFEDSSGSGLRAPGLEQISAIVGDLQIEPEVVRPANLEDVFLMVTGRELSANA